MWLNNPPLAGETFYVHHWIILRAKKASSSDLAGFRVTINSLIASRNSCICMLLPFLFPFHWLLVSFLEKQISLFSDTVQHNFVLTCHRWGELGQGFESEWWTETSVVFHLLNQCFCERFISHFGIWYCFGKRFPHKAPYCVTYIWRKC